MQATTLMSGDGAHWRPSFLPDGRHFLFRVANGGIYIGSLDSPERTKVVDNPGASNSFFAQGYVLFLRERTLMALPLDQKRLVPIGEAIPIADQIQTVSNPGSAVFSVSSSGVLAYQTGTSGAYP